MPQLSQFNGGGRRRTARLLALLLPSALVVLLMLSMGVNADAQTAALPRIMTMHLELVGNIPLVFENGLVYVDGASGEDTGACGDMATPCRTIGHTLANRTADGATLFVASGVYTENLTINNLDVTLRGGYSPGSTRWSSQAGETVIDGGGVDRTFLVHGGSQVVLEDLTITGGRAPEQACWGGGLSVTNGHVTVRRSTVRDNQARCTSGQSGGGAGGGLDANNDEGPASLHVEDSMLLRNEAGDHGSALSTWQTTVVLTNVVVAGNGRHVLALNQTTFNAAHMTMVDNAQDGAALLDFDSASTITLLNSIIWNSGGIACGEGGGLCNFTYSDLEGGWPGEGNLDTDPIFASAATGNYRLRADSPLIDAGAAQGAADHDLDGNPRPLNAGFDIGAYEFTGTPGPNVGDRYVSANGDDAGPNLCLDPAHPCATIQHALDMANPDESVLVAGGVYTENLTIARSVTIVGGLDPTTWNRNLSVFESIILGAPSLPLSQRMLQDLHPVVEVVEDTATVVLDGLSLTGGYGVFAGGVQAGNATVTIRNCYIHDNRAVGTEESQAGAAVVAFNGGGLTIENSRLQRNTIDTQGGAAGVRTHSAPLHLVNCVVSDNRGDMSVHANGPVTIVHSTIANGDGGILINPPDPAQLHILNSIVYGTDWAIGHEGEGVADVRYTLVEGGYDGEGNIDADPQFVDAANGDYRLQTSSPAVNAGTPNYPDALTTDLEGRVRDWQPDLGAYELPLVDLDASARGIVLPATAAVGQPLQPAAAVLNAGATALVNPTPVRCTIVLDASILYSQTVAASAPWAPFVWQSLELPPFTPAAAGIYTVTCTTQLAGDERPENDSHSQAFAVINDAADSWSKDNPTDDGTIPSGLNDWYQSPDIWVRHADDNGVVHQDPIAGVPNYVYARLRNRGTQPLTGTLELSWIAPSLGARCGDWAPIGAIPFANLQPGELRIVKTAWTPAQSGHTCLQALQDSADDPYDRALECTPLWVPWDNNLTWRNVNIFDNPATPGRSVAVTAATFDLVNPYNAAQAVDLIVDKQRWPSGGAVLLTLPGELFAQWNAAGAMGENIEVLTPTQQVRLTAGAQSTLRGLPLNATEAAPIAANFNGPAGADFMLDFAAQIHGATIGGVSYHWIVDSTPPAVQAATPAPGSTAVALDAPIVLTFSHAMAPESLSLTASPPLAGWEAIWNETRSVATITHSPLRSAAAYTVTALAFDDNSIALAAPYVWSFHTEARVYLPTIVR